MMMPDDHQVVIPPERSDNYRKANLKKMIYQAQHKKNVRAVRKNMEPCYDRKEVSEKVAPKLLPGFPSTAGLNEKKPHRRRRYRGNL